MALSLAERRGERREPSARRGEPAFSRTSSRWPEAEVPVGHVTNGVHVPSWDSAEADEVWTQACGAGRWARELNTAERDFASVSDGALWGMRQASRRALIEYARTRLGQQFAAAGAAKDRLAEILARSEVLTLVRPRSRRTSARTLLHDRARLLRLLSDPARPVQPHPGQPPRRRGARP
jgi:starch phosphorylase